MLGLSGYKNCSGGLDPHHITHRGAGGDDIPENVITLCRHHHNLVHNGTIPRSKLYAILTERYGYRY